jgi:hypothetical protein
MCRRHGIQAILTFCQIRADDLHLPSSSNRRRKMATWVVYRLIRALTPPQHIPKLLITQVPEDRKVTRDLLERAGFFFEEFGELWANHYIEKIGPDSPSDLVGRARNPSVPRITWAELVEQANAPVE